MEKTHTAQKAMCSGQKATDQAAVCDELGVGMCFISHISKATSSDEQSVHWTCD